MNSYATFAGTPNAAAAHQGPLTVADTAVTFSGLGVTLHADTRFVIVSVETAQLRMTVNGTTPTSTLGFLYSPGAQILISRAEFANARFIRAGGTSAAIQVAQFST